jgi:3-dehydroquinate dehydratase/shikimate dehydrogenase
MICIPITASNINEAKNDMKEASKIADILELRLDFIRNINEKNLKKLVKNKKKKIIVTDRKKRLNLLKKAIELKADLIDLDLSLGEKKIKKIIGDKNKTKVIVSFHNFKKTDKKELTAVFEKIKKLNPDIIKVATFANNINDNLIIFGLIKKAKKQNKKIIALCMGEKGGISRILSVPLGAELTFGSLKQGKESAPGQITAKILKEVYRVNKLKNPKIFGLVGNPVKHSKGIIIHNKAFEKSKLNNIYVNFLVDDLASFIKGFKGIVSGLSVTIPFKTEVMKHLGKVDLITKKIGAVNTVVKKGNKLIGYNTDCVGAIRAIEEKTKIKNKDFVILGAGGAARAIAFGIKQKKGNLIILNRTVKKAEKLAKELKCAFGGLKLSYLNVDCLINTTSIGMFPKVNESLVNKKLLKNMVVFDAIYNPRMTKLLKDAKSNKCKIILGAEMFVNQATEQLKLWSGKNVNKNYLKRLV